jgi:glycosyltransferase involved in cell wall biosynthesis
MVTFRELLLQGITSKGLHAVHRLEDWPYATVLVVGGSRQLPSLRQAKQRGVRIVQRLDGMNWIHRVRRTGWKHYIRAEYGNFLLSLIRSRIADHLVYQSEFARRWWERKYGPVDTPAEVIVNGVDLDRFKPLPGIVRSEDALRVLLVEGSLLGGYEIGLEMAAKLVVDMAQPSKTAHSHNGFRSINLEIVGKVDSRTRERWDAWLKEQKSALPLRLIWRGILGHGQVPEANNQAHLFFSSDINPACPNSVIEAMACGTPVIAFDTGALRELVGERGGAIVPYGGDPWALDPPDIPALAQAAGQVLKDQKGHREAARIRAEETFDGNQMVSSYLDVLLPGRAF